MGLAQFSTVRLAASREDPSHRPGGGLERHELGAAAFPLRPVAFLWHYVRRRPVIHVAAVASVLGAASFACFAQYGLKLIVDAMAHGPQHIAAVWWALALFAALLAGESMLWRSGSWFGYRAILTDKAEAKLDLFNHLSGHSSRYFSDRMGGSLANRISAAGDSLQQVFSTLLFNIAPVCAGFCAALAMLATVDWHLVAALFVFVVLAASTLARLSQRGMARHRLYADHAADVGGEMMYVERMRVLHDLALWLMAGGMLGWTLHLWSVGKVSPGDVVLTLAMAFRILHGSRDLAFALVNASQFIARIADSIQVIGENHRVVDQPDAGQLIPLGGRIVFDNIDFSYPGGEPVFRGLPLKIAPGQHVALVGPSGAGKSTLISLLQRLVDVDEGRVLIDNQDIRAMRQDSLRAAIAVVPQEISLFHRSVLENIRYARPEAADEDVLAAARAARCDDFIRALPQGYHTTVGERGDKLSGGQRQRLGIARALLKNAPIIVLDEATSALDSASEVEIQQALEVLMRGRTVLAIAHRLSTVAKFDRVVVLEDGRIVEDGPPAELRRRHGSFDQMCRLQENKIVALAS